MSNTKMRAKVQVGSVIPVGVTEDGKVTNERLVFHGVGASRYPESGADENNTFARFSPSVMFDMQVMNPALIGQFKVGDTFYVDFTPVG